MLFRFFVVPVLMCLCSLSAATAQLSFDLPPINYSTTEASDPVARLSAKVASGDIDLEEHEGVGYLTALLRELDIPLSSQSLVFSKTSLQRHIISPANPRAIYFNDETYVGWVPHGEVIEISSTDPSLGTTFYTVEQYSPRKPVRISRRTERCLFCHASSDTGRVPGLIMQSNYTGEDGHRVFPSDSMWAKSSGALQARWAGWFVTGNHGKQTHLGNLMVDSGDEITAESERKNGNVTDLSKWFDTKRYPTPHSDLVALLILQHQVSIHNLLTNTNHRSRKLLYDAAIDNRDNDRDEAFLSAESAITLDQLAETLVDGLLMVDALVFTEPVSGSSRFAEEFSARKPTDSQGRSLRQLDLKTRLFRFPCSYLIYSESFDKLPEPVMQRVRVRLDNVLSNKDARTKYSHLSRLSRIAIREILCETKPGLFN